MCWFSKNIPLKRIAEKDIQVQKILYRKGKEIHSPIQREFLWEKGVFYTTELGEPEKTPTSDAFVISKGFHSAMLISSNSGDWVTIFGGHGRKVIFTKEKGELIFNAFIPKGATYYVNDYNEYVSNQLMLE